MAKESTRQAFAYFLHEIFLRACDIFGRCRVFFITVLDIGHLLSISIAGMGTVKNYYGFMTSVLYVFHLSKISWDIGELLSRFGILRLF